MKAMKKKTNKTISKENDGEHTVQVNKDTEQKGRTRKKEKFVTQCRSWINKV
jgi:hypothetical protein